MSRLLSIFCIKIVLENTKPSVWRRLEVPSNMSLNNLAFALNAAMGWECSHLYLYECGEQEFGNPEYDEEGAWEDDRKIFVYQMAKKTKTFKYVYDFGDDWQHLITLEGEFPANPKEKYPKVIDGANACPPEDCGGVHGFEEYKEAISNRSHPRYREMMDWRGVFDPTDFDINLANLFLIRRKIPKNAKLMRFSKKMVNSMSRS